MFMAGDSLALPVPAQFQEPLPFAGPGKGVGAVMIKSMWSEGMRGCGALPGISVSLVAAVPPQAVVLTSW